jgi:tetratricopeptide (TPR) repeat protein
MDGYRAGVLATRAAVLRMEIVRVERARGRYDAALSEVDALLAAQDGRARLLSLRGAILAQAGRSREARASYEAALADAERMVARRPVALALLARAEARLGLGQRDAAVADLEAAVALAPHDGDMLRLLASLRRGNGGVR